MKEFFDVDYFTFVVPNDRFSRKNHIGHFQALSCEVIVNGV